IISQTSVLKTFLKHYNQAAREKIDLTKPQSVILQRGMVPSLFSSNSEYGYSFSATRQTFIFLLSFEYNQAYQRRRASPLHFSLLNPEYSKEKEWRKRLFLHRNCLITASVSPFEIYSVDDNSEFRVRVPMTHIRPWSLLSFRYIADDHRLHSTCPSLIVYINCQTSWSKV
ncbi:hypothetical protein M8C21_026335, partial [Ambrosia artemisiifolia]